MKVEDNFKFQGRRRLLALELKKKGIVNKQIIKSIESIPRHLFIDPGLSEQAYMTRLYQLNLIKLSRSPIQLLSRLNY